jgi:hypothetical protein
MMLRSCNGWLHPYTLPVIVILFHFHHDVPSFLSLYHSGTPFTSVITIQGKCTCVQGAARCVRLQLSRR